MKRKTTGAKDDLPVGGRYPTRIYLTKTREIVTPLLPPPIVTAARVIDAHPLVNAYVGDEATAAFVSAALLALLVYRIARALNSAAFRRSTLHEDVDDSIKPADVGLKKGFDYDDTAVLFGPAGAGKTVLFRGLCYGDNQVGGGKSSPFHTVMSLRANAALLQKKEGGRLALRLIDQPGHPVLLSRLPPTLLEASRAVLVVDSTKPVAEASEILYDVLTDPSICNVWNKGGGKTEVLVCCAKSDIKGAKNWRRIKIQLRTELERLVKVRAAERRDTSGKYMDAEEVTGKKHNRFSLASKIDLDNLGDCAPATLSFLSVGWEKGIDELKNFVVNGTIPHQSPTAGNRMRKE